MHALTIAAEWIGFLGVMGAGWCLYRRIQARRYRRAKREALTAAEWSVRAAEAETERRAAHEARAAVRGGNLDNAARKT